MPDYMRPGPRRASGLGAGHGETPCRSWPASQRSSKPGSAPLCFKQGQRRASIVFAGTDATRMASYSWVASFANAHAAAAVGLDDVRGRSVRKAPQYVATRPARSRRLDRFEQSVELDRVASPPGRSELRIGQVVPGASTCDVGKARDAARNGCEQPRRLGCVHVVLVDRPQPPYTGYAVLRRRT